MGNQRRELVTLAALTDQAALTTVLASKLWIRIMMDLMFITCIFFVWGYWHFGAKAWLAPHVEWPLFERRTVIKGCTTGLFCISCMFCNSTPEVPHLCYRYNRQPGRPRTNSKAQKLRKRGRLTLTNTSGDTQQWQQLRGSSSICSLGPRGGGAERIVQVGACTLLLFCHIST